MFSANDVTIDESSSARFLRQVKATPNKAIGNLFLSDKKRKPDEDLTSADAKKINGATQTGDATAAVVSETTMTDADIQYQIDQLERQDKLAKLQAELCMRKEAAKKAQSGMASVGEVGRYMETGISQRQMIAGQNHSEHGEDL